VVRLFAMLKDLQKLLAAVSSAVYPVCNAFLILLVIASIYAILGRRKSPRYLPTSTVVVPVIVVAVVLVFVVALVLGFGVDVVLVFVVAAIIRGC